MKLPLFRLRIQGHSMEPTLKNGSQVLASGIHYWFTSPKINDIVVFKTTSHPGKRSASRIRFWIFDQNDGSKLMIKRIVKQKKDQYLVAGDNKKDSLEVGWISRREIVGKIIFKF